MSKATVKCPSCGKQCPAAMRYCGWCGFDMKVGASKRVESLPRPEEKTPTSQSAPQPTPQPVPQPTQQPAPQPMQQPAQEPVQPVVAKQPAVPPTATKAKKPNPVQEPVPKQKPVNPNRMAAAKNPAAAKKRKSSGKITAIVAALVVIVLVIVIAAVLFRSQGGNDKPPVSADFDNNVHVVDANESASPKPTDTTQPDETEAPAESPDATDAPAPVDETEPGEDGMKELSDTVYVTGSGVNLRTGPGTTYEVIGSLARGTELKRTGEVSGWSRVLYNDETCYISSALISTDAPETAEAEQPNAEAEAEAEEKTTVVVISRANVRSGPGTGYRSLGVLDVGTELESLGTSGNWTIVSYNGEEAFIFSSLIATKGEKGTVTVIADANIRAGDGTEYDIVGKVKTGDVLTMHDHTESNWYKVELSDGQIGYIAGNMVREN